MIFYREASLRAFKLRFAQLFLFAYFRELVFCVFLRVFRFEFGASSKVELLIIFNYLELAGF